MHEIISIHLATYTNIYRYIHGLVQSMKPFFTNTHTHTNTAKYLSFFIIWIIFSHFFVCLSFFFIFGNLKRQTINAISYYFYFFSSVCVCVFPSCSLACSLISLHSHSKCFRADLTLVNDDRLN